RQNIVGLMQVHEALARLLRKVCDFAVQEESRLVQQSLDRMNASNCAYFGQLLPACGSGDFRNLVDFGSRCVAESDKWEATRGQLFDALGQRLRNPTGGIQGRNEAIGTVLPNLLEGGLPF